MTLQYATKEAYDVYIDYLALKQHFTKDTYDYVKFNGKVKAAFDKFQTRNDAFFFYKLSKDKEYHNILLSNLLKNPNMWIREMCDEEAHERYTEWKKVMDGLGYVFKQDLSKLDDDYKSNFVVHDGQNPLLLTLYLQKKITLETFTIVTNLSNVFPYWETSINDQVFAKGILRTAKKYYPLMDIDKNKFTLLIKSVFFDDK